MKFSCTCDLNPYVIYEKVWLKPNCTLSEIRKIKRQKSTKLKVSYTYMSFYPSYHIIDMS